MSAVKIIEKMRQIHSDLSAHMIVVDEILKGVLYRRICAKYGMENNGLKTSRSFLFSRTNFHNIKKLFQVFRGRKRIVFISHDDRINLDHCLELAAKHFNLKIGEEHEVAFLYSNSKILAFLSSPLSVFIFLTKCIRLIVYNRRVFTIPYSVRYLARESWIIGTSFVISIIVRKNIQFIFTRPHFSFEAMSWVAFAKKNKIPVVEIGHGMINGRHPFYLDFSGIHSQEQRLIPDWFIVRSQREFDFIYAEMGSVAAIYEYDDYLEPSMVQRLKKSLNLRQDLKLGVFSLQDIFLEAGYLTKLLSVIQSNVCDFWIISEHPMHSDQIDFLKSEMKGMGIKNIVFAGQLGVSTHQALGMCDLHASHSSSVLYEAADMGLRNYVCSDYGRQLVADLVKTGDAEYLEL